MLNRAVYQKDPSTRNLVNEGVAFVNDETTEAAHTVLRYELDTFVCDGQYEKGMEHMLRTYLDNLSATQQPAVWVSGFFGSGKSHLVKMMRALWADTRFSDGATARGIAHLPPAVCDLLAELSTQGKRLGGLHAASGTLGSGANGSVRLAILGIVFKSVDLPEQYHLARFVLWLKAEGIYEQVRGLVEQKGYNWQEELDNFFVAEGLPAALIDAKPNLFSSVAGCLDTLRQQYPFVTDITSAEMVKAIRQALTREGRFPLTLLVLDEIQQFIGGDSRRSSDVQEAVEACKNIGPHLLFVGSGQTAVMGTPLLQRLAGRFTIRIELSDADVDTVIRQVVLAKQPKAIAAIEEIMTANLGEIARHLAGTTLGHRPEDAERFAQDYPILPVRRRFWEQCLRVLDQSGADSQLRSQLSMVHKAIQTNLDRPVGSVVAADYLYFDAADRLLQARVLPRKVYAQTMVWRQGTEDEQLLARACGLVFLVNKLAGSNQSLAIRATNDTLADLLVEELAQGSSTLRSRLPALLGRCELLMQVGDEYRIQTEESTAWNDEFMAQRALLSSDANRIDAERGDRLRGRVGAIVKQISLLQGAAKVSRELHVTFDAVLPNDSDRQVYAWVRDGWSSDENSCHADARQGGNLSPTIYLFLPRRSADDLRSSIIDYKAAKATLDKRGLPGTPEGSEARAAIETILHSAETRIDELLDDVFAGVRVFQGGGAEVIGADLHAMLSEAAKNSLARLYSEFQIADLAGWDKVYANAQKGAPDALKAVGDSGEPANNPICKRVLNYLGSGKSGSDVRSHFESAPYGWSRDAIDAALQVLLVAGLVRAVDDHGRPVDARDLERKAIGKSQFKIESATVSAAQRVQIRMLLQQAGVSAKTNEEAAALPEFFAKLDALALRAGGEPPKPAPPLLPGLAEARQAGGNAQLLAVYNLREELGAAIKEWKNRGDAIEARRPAWQQLQRLLTHAQSLPDAAILQTQVDEISRQRRLLAEPDLVTPLLDGVAQLLRTQINRVAAQYDAACATGEQRLQGDSNWAQLDAAQQENIRLQQHIQCGPAEQDGTGRPAIDVGTTAAILATLDALPLSALADRTAALPSRFAAAVAAAARLLEPQTQFVKLPQRTLKDAQAVDDWLREVEQQLKAALAAGPVAIQ